MKGSLLQPSQPPLSGSESQATPPYSACSAPSPVFSSHKTPSQPNRWTAQLRKDSCPLYSRFQSGASFQPSITSGFGASDPSTQASRTPNEFQLPTQSAHNELGMRDVVICNYLMSSSLKAFCTENSYRMYKEYHRLGRQYSDFASAKKNQNQGKGLPLLLAQRPFNPLTIGEHVYINISKCVPCPEASDRLYDKVDNRQVGQVYRKAHFNYTTYRLIYEGLQVVAIRHNSLDIFDFKIGNDRFRFLEVGRDLLDPGHVTCDLYQLSSSQNSLLDGLTGDYKLNKQNPLVGNRFKILFRTSLRTPVTMESDIRCGRIECFKSSAAFTRTIKTAVLSVFTSSNPYEIDKNSSVEYQTEIFVCIALIYKSIEDDKATARRSQRSG